MKRKSLTVMFCGGGTGGHIFPPLAVAQRLKEKHADARILFLGKKGKIEETLAVKNKFIFYDIPCCQFPEKKITDFFRFLFRTLAGIITSLKVVLREKPDFIIGSGGYVSIPGLAAGVLTGKKIYLLEQNAIPGKTNKTFSFFAKKIFAGLPLDQTTGLSAKWVLTGNPLRKTLELISRDAALSYFGLDKKLFCIGVIGGSQGASKLNDIIPESLSLMRNKDKIQVIHIAGEKHENEAKTKYANFKIRAKVSGFINEIENFYSAADVVISRSGALALSEISRYGLPALLIPFPFAAQDHQKINARLAADTGAAFCLSEEEAIPPRIADLADKILDNEELRGKMRKSWEKFYIPESTDKIIRIIEKDADVG
ncbi:MAG: undecaprenyldiphospho-muramoylpentapeptide beta-N-acetylglucosaminyltransferase [bacterium]|nr:undecaprenyldiphospho-muramoylpentapeptide beta-N-acetylglucosaminyltransferase [bacterium]